MSFRLDLVRHEDCFSRSCCAVIHRSVRNIHFEKVRYHRLEFKYRLKRSLAYFGLIGSVGSVELASRDHLVNESGAVVFVAAAAKEGEHVRARIFLAELVHHLFKFGFAFCRGDVQLFFEENVLRKR